MKEGKKKTIAEFSGCFMPLLRHHHSATTQVRPSTSQEVKPSQGIVWPGSLFNTQSLPPSLHLGKPQGREPKSQERTWFRGPPSNPTLTNWCRKGREACPLLGWVLQGLKRPPGRCRREVAICARRSVLKSPTGARGLLRPGTPGPVRVSGAALSSQPSEHRRQQHRGHGLRPASRQTAGDRGPRLGPESHRARPRPT